MFKVFQQYPNVVAGVSQKTDGAMGLSFQIENDEEIRKRRQGFLQKFGVDVDKLITAGLVHGKNVAIADRTHAGAVEHNTDALVTNSRDIFLAITIADCLPIFFFDPVQNVVAIAHAGWKGIVQEIAAEAVHTIVQKFHSHPEDIVIGIGPHICPEHYEIQRDVEEQFIQYGEEVVVHRGGKTFLDLAKVVSIQLLGMGVNGSNISVSGDCTYTLHDTYYSYRRDKPEHLETMMAFIGLRENEP